MLTLFKIYNICYINSISIFREFIEAQKIWVVRERERVDRENREIAAFIENKDKWKVQVTFINIWMAFLKIY